MHDVFVVALQGILCCARTRKKRENQGKKKKKPTNKHPKVSASSAKCFKTYGGGLAVTSWIYEQTLVGVIDTIGQRFFAGLNGLRDIDTIVLVVGKISIVPFFVLFAFVPRVVLAIVALVVLVAVPRCEGRKVMGGCRGCTGGGEIVVEEGITTGGCVVVAQGGTWQCRCGC